MTICGANHEEICFEGRNCPLCEKIDENEELRKEKETLEERLSNHERV